MLVSAGLGRCQLERTHLLNGQFREKQDHAKLRVKSGWMTYKNYISRKRDYSLIVRICAIQFKPERHARKNEAGTFALASLFDMLALVSVNP
jgi:hypothetical protein